MFDKGFKSEVVLGQKYRDTVSGYEGVATAVAFYLHGCERVTLEQWVERAGELRELTFDAPRLTKLAPVAAPVDTLTTRRTGGFKPPIPRTGATR